MQTSLIEAQFWISSSTVFCKICQKELHIFRNQVSCKKWKLTPNMKCFILIFFLTESKLLFIPNITVSEVTGYMLDNQRSNRSSTKNTSHCYHVMAGSDSHQYHYTVIHTLHLLLYSRKCVQHSTPYPYTPSGCSV